MYQSASSSGGGRGGISELFHQGEFLEDGISVELTSSQQLELGCCSGGLIHSCQAEGKRREYVHVCVHVCVLQRETREC